MKHLLNAFIGIVRHPSSSGQGEKIVQDSDSHDQTADKKEQHKGQRMSPGESNQLDYKSDQNQKGCNT
jgi:hypothetical protein